MIEIKTTNFLVIKVLLAYGIVGSTAAILLYLLVLGGELLALLKRELQ